MNKFDARRVLLECGTTPLDDSFRREENGVVFYRKILPFHCSAWNEGSFYFQTVLIEYDFSIYLPEHQTKRTISFAARDPNTKPIRNLEGNVVEYPVFTFYIVVNRHLYSSRREGEDSVEWHVALTGRTQGIAHEILYAEQYAANYNWNASNANPPISIPHIDREHELLCPYETIERLLRTQEQRFGLPLKAPQQFLENESTSIVQSYLREWLENFSVEAEICYARTMQYLQTGVRSNCEDKIKCALEHCKQAHSLRCVTLDEFQRSAKTNSSFYSAFIQTCQSDGFRSIDEATIRYLAERYLNDHHV